LLIQFPLHAPVFWPVFNSKYYEPFLILFHSARLLFSPHLIIFSPSIPSHTNKQKTQSCRNKQNATMAG
jgi:hypothetical protein